jgi:hypothetical protein
LSIIISLRNGPEKWCPESRTDAKQGGESMKIESKREFYRDVAEDGMRRFVAEARRLQEAGIDRDLVLAALLEAAFALVRRRRAAGSLNLLGLKLFSLHHRKYAEKALEGVRNYATYYVPGKQVTARDLDLEKASLEALEITADMSAPEARTCLDAFLRLSDSMQSEPWEADDIAYAAVYAGFDIALQAGASLLMRFLRTLWLMAESDLKPLKDMDNQTLAVQGAMPC